MQHNNQTHALQYPQDLLKCSLTQIRAKQDKYTMDPG